MLIRKTLFFLWYLIKINHFLILEFNIKLDRGKCDEIQLIKPDEPDRIIESPGCPSNNLIKTKKDVQVNWKILIKFDPKYSSAHIDGNIVIDGYSIPINNRNNFWNGQISYDSYYSWYYFYSPNNQLEFVIPIESDLPKYSNSNPSPQFNCKSEFHQLLFKTNVSLKLNITPVEDINSKNPNKIVFVLPTNFIGSIFNIDDNSVVTSEEPISFTSFQYNSNSSIEETYYQQVDYYLFQAPDKKDCNITTINLLVCGKGCKDCSLSTKNCTECDTGYSFLENNRKQCYKTDVYLNKDSPPFYYLSDNNTLYQCHENCGTCSGKPDFSSAFEQFNCKTCAELTPLFVETGELKNNCYDECPENYYIKEELDICVKTCTSNYKYQYKDSNGKYHCLYECNKAGRNYAKYKIFREDECLDECSEPYQYQMRDQHICLSSCSNESGYPYIYNNNSVLTCVEQCPEDANLTINDNECTATCPSDYPYQYNEKNMCLHECSDKDVYKIDNDTLYICASNCSETSYPYHMITSENIKICTSECHGGKDYLDEETKTCVASCDTKFSYETNKTCVSVCSENDFPYEYTKNDKSKQCVANCTTKGQYLAGIGNKCVRNCADLYSFIYCGKCVNKCPDDAKYTLGNGKQCVIGCDTTYKYLSGTKCVKTCFNQTDNKYLVDGTVDCVSKCPDNKPYIIESITLGVRKCVDTCDTGYPYIDGNKCAKNCGSKILNPLNNTCVLSCPEQKPFNLDGVCSEQCSDVKPYIDNNKCVASCGPGKYYLNSNKTCVSSCKGTTENFLVNKKYCNTSCPDSYPYQIIDIENGNNECVDKCEGGLRYLQFKNFCVSSCPYDYPYKVDQVEDGKKYCTNKCSEFSQVINPNNECKPKCPVNDYKYLYPDENDGICVQKCYGKYPYTNTINSTCVEDCTGIYSYKVKSTKFCYTQCPTTAEKYEIENTKECIADCANSATSRYKFKNGYINKCVAICNNDTFPYISADETQCTPYCRNSHIKEGTNQCITNCVFPYPYYKEVTNECLSTCQDFIIEGTGGQPDKCVPFCPSYLPYLDGKTCVANCKDRAINTYINNNDKHCVIGCSNGYEYLVEETDGTKTCYQECPLAYPYEIETTKVCTNSCGGINLYIQEKVYKDIGNKILGPNKRCTSVCSEPLPFLYEQGRICLENCNGHYKYGLDNKCVDSCIGDYPYLIERDNICTDSCKDNLMYISSDKTKCLNDCPSSESIVTEDNSCVTTCSGDTPYRDANTRQCVSGCGPGQFFYDKCLTECPTKTYTILATSQCVDRCDVPGYEFKIEEKKLCVTQCDHENYTLTDDINHECLDDCTKSNSNVYQYNDKCVSSCPDLHKAINNKCQFDLDFEGVSEGKRVSAYTKAQLDEILSDNENIQSMYNLHATIKGLDFVLQVYSTDAPFEDMEGVSSLDFSQCEDVIRENEVIGLNEKIIICKIDTWNNETVTSDIEYKAYKEDGTPIELEKCNIVDSVISSPFNYDSSINYELGYNLSLQGIDIFNENDPFYTDICSQFELDNKDVLLSQRKSLYYQNVSFCAEGCIYQNISYETKKINCECPFNVGNANPSQAIGQNEISEDFLNKSDPMNMNTIKCSNLITWENIKENAAFWIGSSMTIGTVSLSIVTFASSFSSMCSNISVFFASNPIVKKDNYFVNEKATDISNTNRKFSVDSIDTVISNGGKSSSKEFLEYSNEIKPKQNSIYYESNEKDSKDIFVLNCNREEKKESQGEHRLPVFQISHIDYLPFYLALKYDNREYCKMLINILSQKVMLLRCLVKRSPFEMRSLNLSVYMLFLISLFTFNALFYSNGMIQNKFNDKEGNDILLRALVSSILSVLVYRLFMYLLSFYYLIEALIAESNEKDAVMIMTKRAINRIKLKVILFYVVHSILLCFCWYYLTTFNAVYKCTAMDWMIGGGLSLLLIFIYNTLLVLVITIMRYFGLTVYNKTLYHVAMFMQKYC